MERIVLAYSGGPASSIAIPWLAEQYQAEVVTVTVDLGQHESLDGIRVRALGSGAVRAHVLDRRDVFARHHLLPAMHDGAVDIDSAAAIALLSWPLIAHALIEIAEIEGTRVVAHAATGAEDQARIDAAVQALDANIRVIDAANRWTMAPADMVDYARARGIPLAAPPAGVATSRPAPSAVPVRIAVEFRAGVPVKINGVEMDLVELLISLDTIAGAQGVPGNAVLNAAYRALSGRAGPAAVTGAEVVSVFKGACEVVMDVR